jgi:hypothetical protein
MKQPNKSAQKRTLMLPLVEDVEIAGPEPIFHILGEVERVWVDKGRVKSLHLAEFRDVHTLCGQSHVGMDTLDGSAKICQECHIVASKRLLRIAR